MPPLGIFARMSFWEVKICKLLGYFSLTSAILSLITSESHKMSQIWNNGLKLHTLQNICARYSGPVCSGFWEQCTFATSWKSQNYQNRDILPTVSSPLHRNFTKFSWTLTICVTRNSTKCSELIVHFSQIGSPVHGWESSKMVRLWTRVMWKHTMHTHMNRLTVLWIGFCLTGPISLC